LNNFISARTHGPSLVERGLSSGILPSMEREPVRETTGKTDKMPLWERLYFRQHYIEIARLIGYEGLPLATAQAGIKELGKTHDKEKLVKACEDLLDITADFVRLKTTTRKLCFQLLGPAPEQMDAFSKNSDGSPRQGQQPSAPKPAISPKEAPPPPKAKAEKKPVAKKTAKKASKAEEPKSTPKEKESPIMEQYREAKEKHPDMLLLFRIGDFYELFGEDAETAHKLLGLTLTTRDQTHTMAGFPHHQLEAYLHKLLMEGKRVAICDQVEESLARGPIRREVKRVESPEDSDAAEA
jgi:hypothetical protein